MHTDRGLRLRIVISAFIALLLLGVFIERMSYRNVGRDTRLPASNTEREIQSCEGQDCNLDLPQEEPKIEENSKQSEGALFRIEDEVEGSR